LALRSGDGGAAGLGTAVARGGVGVSRGSGVSDGFAALFFLFAVGDFSGAALFFFFLPLGDGSLVEDFFGAGFALGSGVSLGVADDSDFFDGDFFFFGVGDGDGDFFFFDAGLFGFAVGVGDSSAGFTACARRTGVVLSSVGSA
jgi:hypothetical protein